MQNRWKFLLDSIRVLHDNAYSHIRDKYQEKLLRNLHVVVQFSVVRVVVICILFPRFLKYGGVWVCGVGGFAVLFPQQKRALSWVFLAMMICITTVIIYENGEDYFRCGLSHSSSAATLMVFFGGLGARGAALFATALCLLCYAAAPSNMVTLNIGIACLAQVAMCVVLEVALLQQLAETEKLVEEMRAIDEKKANFMAIVSHELKSPLHGIMGLSSSLMSNEGSDRPAKKHLTLILSCAERLLDMVTNIMDASVLVHDKKMKLSRDLVHFDRVVEDVVVLCRHSVDRNGRPLLRERVSLVNTVGPLPAVEADLHRCTQLMYNLINNALKFTKVGHVKIYGRAEDELGVVTLTVEDTGIGIARENLERIFRPFDQEDESEHRHYEGLGLGLSICKEVVEKHGGTLTVESVKGKGSKFRVMFPYMMQAPSSVVDVDSSVAGETSAFGDTSEVLGDVSANGETMDEDPPPEAALQKNPLEGNTNVSPSCPEDFTRQAAPQDPLCYSSNGNSAHPLGSSAISEPAGLAPTGMAEKLLKATIPAECSVGVEPSVQAGATQSLGLVELPSNSQALSQSTAAAQQIVCHSNLRHIKHCKNREPTQDLVAPATREVWKPPFHGAALFDHGMRGRRWCASEQSVPERWQLQNRVAHLVLALRHRQRDLSRMQTSIQERAQIIEALGNKHCRSQSMCGSAMTFDVEPSDVPLEKLHAEVSCQTLELQQKGLDLVSAELAVRESARRIEALQRGPERWRRGGGGGGGGGGLLEDLEKTVAQLVLDLRHQETVRWAAESALQQQAEVIRRLQFHRQCRCF